MKLKALYSVRDVRRMTGLSRQEIHRWLHDSGCPTVRIGGRTFVTLHALRATFPEVWESVVLKAKIDEAS